MKFPFKFIVGANYGDEGKGLATDFFANDTTLNILTNGGPQRGHTVETADGKRHVFNHFGSGTFRGAHTYLHDTFLVNPAMFSSEYHELMKLLVVPQMKVYINPNCKLITIYDMLVNQAIELSRGKDKHGSCGLGIWETVKRNNANTRLTVDVFDNANYKVKMYLLSEIREYYCDLFKHENINVDPSISVFFNDKEQWSILDKNYISDFEEMCYLSKISTFDQIIFKNNYSNMLCENAQGLLLDWDRNDIENNHATPSYTGAWYYINFFNEFASSIDIFYITRSYMTRHGAGNLKNECSFKELGAVGEGIDYTNIPNDWQGTIRYAPLNMEELDNRIMQDFNRAKDFANVPITKNLFITHLNELAIQEIKNKDSYTTIIESDKKFNE